ncbi:MAG TPA: PLP-dependent aminotransferase family protein [Hyphomicrobiaceae bacterium]|nr:PLP-dependent aminotransferase family protein [Hyphomicrobiaceae bacterium]
MTAIEYTGLVDELAAAIAAGRLKPGERLLPQRAFAFEKGIAASTAGRVYAELLRRGLVVGEVGRGTFVAGSPPPPGSVRGEPRDGRIDLEFNFPTVAAQFELITACVRGLQRVDAMSSCMGPVTQGRLESARHVTAEFTRTARWQPRPDGIVFTGCGRQSIAAAISALVPIGGRIGVEAITYATIKSIAARLGVTVVPIAFDGEGIRPDAVAKAHRSGALAALYLQPVLHNPIGHSMSAARRQEIANLAARLGLFIIEDLVYGFLSDDPPLAASAPDRCIVVDSLSKRIAPGVAVGFLHVPAPLRERVATTVRAGAWSVSSLALDLGSRLLGDGTAAEITRLKRTDARKRQAIVAKCLAGFEISADPRSYHVWLQMPQHWRSEAFAAAAARHGISLTPSHAFTIAPGHAPNAVRLALGLPTHAQLRAAGDRLAQLLGTDPDEADVTE